MANWLRELGHLRVILSSDGEPALVACRNAPRRKLNARPTTSRAVSHMWVASDSDGHAEVAVHTLGYALDVLQDLVLVLKVGAHAAHHTERHPQRVDHRRLSDLPSKTPRPASAAFSYRGPEFILATCEPANSCRVPRRQKEGPDHPPTRGRPVRRVSLLSSNCLRFQVDNRRTRRVRAPHRRECLTVLGEALRNLGPLRPPCGPAHTQRCRHKGGVPWYAHGAFANCSSSIQLSSPIPLLLHDPEIHRRWSIFHSTPVPVLWNIASWISFGSSCMNAAIFSLGDNDLSFSFAKAFN